MISKINSLITQQINYIQQKQLASFCNKIYPAQSAQNITSLVSKTILQYIKIQRLKKIDLSKIIKDLKQIGGKVNKRIINIVNIIEKNLPNQKVNQTSQRERKGNLYERENMEKLDFALNIAKKSHCICGKQTYLISPEKQPCFSCFQCSTIFHSFCMKITDQDYLSMRQIICIFCYIKMMDPKVAVIQQIFLGIFKSNKREFLFQFSKPQDLNHQQKIELRSIKIQKKRKFQIKFPESKIIFNDSFQVQSNCNGKYLIPKRNLTTQNKITIQQHNFKKEGMKQSYLISLFVIKDKSIENLISDAFNEKNKIKCQQNFFRQFLIKNEEVWHQMIKIKLTCCYFKNLIQIPVRSILCRHHQCFDLKIFLQLLNKKQKPYCPICKVPAYKFQIDFILYMILEVYKYVPLLQTIIFDENGNFEVYNEKEERCQTVLKNINELESYFKSKNIHQLNSSQQKQSSQNEI